MRAAAAALLVALPSSAAAAEGVLPDHAKLQFAGDIGFLSAGPGWSWWKGKAETDLLAGWVPEAIGGDDLFTLTAKQTFLPWRLAWDSGWRVEAITFGLFAAYTFGEDYWLFQPGHYPDGYYTYSTALRLGLFAGGGAGFELSGETRLDFYYELLTTDFALYAHLENPDVVPFFHAFNLALGAKVSF